MRFICIESYMIPTFGNRRTEPYGRMVVEHNLSLIHISEPTRPY